VTNLISGIVPLVGRQKTFSIEEVRRIGQPMEIVGPKAGEPGRYYLRRISPYVTVTALRLGISANHLTVIMGITGIVSALAFQLSGYFAMTGFVGIQIYLLFDCVDGEIARVRKQESIIGLYLDRLWHYVVEALVVASIALRASEFEANIYAFLAPINAFLLVMSKSAGDLVVFASVQGMTEKMGPSPATNPDNLVNKTRSIYMKFPIHRIHHAPEAAALYSVAVVADELLATRVATQVLTISLTAILLMIALARPLVTIGSGRLGVRDSESVKAPN